MLNLSGIYKNSTFNGHSRKLRLVILQIPEKSYFSNYMCYEILGSFISIIAMAIMWCGFWAPSNFAVILVQWLD